MKKYKKALAVLAAIMCMTGSASALSVSAYNWADEVLGTVTTDSDGYFNYDFADAVAVSGNTDYASVATYWNNYDVDYYLDHVQTPVTSGSIITGGYYAHGSPGEEQFSIFDCGIFDYTWGWANHMWILEGSDTDTDSVY